MSDNNEPSPSGITWQEKMIRWFKEHGTPTNGDWMKESTFTVGDKPTPIPWSDLREADAGDGSPEPLASPFRLDRF